MQANCSIKKKILLFMLVGIFFSCRNPKDTKVIDESPGNTAENRRQWLKDYALCDCMLYATNKDSVIQSDISFSILREISAYDDRVYDIIDSVSKKTVDAVKPAVIADYNGKKSMLMSCIEFHRSKMLDSMVKSFDPKVGK